MVEAYLVRVSTGSVDAITHSRHDARKHFAGRRMPLDQLIHDHGLGKVTFVKIDVEGAELMALRGMRGILKRFRS